MVTRRKTARPSSHAPAVVAIQRAEREMRRRRTSHWAKPIEHSRARPRIVAAGPIRDPLEQILGSGGGMSRPAHRLREVGAREGRGRAGHADLLVAMSASALAGGVRERSLGVLTTVVGYETTRDRMILAYGRASGFGVDCDICTDCPGGPRVPP